MFSVSTTFSRTQSYSVLHHSLLLFLLVDVNLYYCLPFLFSARKTHYADQHHHGQHSIDSMATT